ncbi:hybrid sensor histidine kinase/response regulator [Variovorax saccharolyticus]|uniref:hybrid sensor histidine kinase/response regulator n=1 Tax=Variovorax saccharolyticus TaxID=3053516 RepID=UPI002577CF3F|nr:PAS domain-containing sensor histidine kinase [Variovorax sp. J22R187]MDM0019243.1 PAS domain S-box protein [Variovorax sp. J22R187]
MDQSSHLSTTLGPEERYRLLVDAVEEYAIYMLDPDGFVISWNSGAQRLKGYAEAEILGRHFSTFYTPDDVRAGAPTRTLNTAQREGRFETEGWRCCKDGRRFWAQVLIHPIRSPSGELLGYAKVTRDLTERRNAEDALRRSEEQFRLLVQAVTDYAIYMLDPTGLITSWNTGAQRIKGYAPDEVIGTNFSRFYRTGDQTRGEPAKALATAASEGRFESEGWRVRKDGSEFWASVVIDPVLDANGSLIGFAKVTRDITEKRRAQQELEQARDALFQAQKLDAIGQLTGGVAHDFNNLLMVVLSSLELLRRRLPADEKLQGLVNNAIQGARRGASLTQRMLSFARRQDLAPVAVDVPRLVDGMREMLARTLGSAIRIETVFPAAPDPVLVDPNQLELAILNLCVNARDAMPEGGRLELKVEEKSVAAAAELRPGAYVCLSISDTGAGMDAATLEKAVEPFFTTKGVGKGTGLGLPMVQGLAAQSGGRFVLKSTEGAGTTAELWLPVAQGAADAVAAESDADGGAKAGERSPPLLVVAVDDDSLVLANTTSMLEDLGHSVITAGSAQDALNLVRGEPAVGLVVSDQVMPGMTGAQLFAVLRKERPELPLILATGYAELPPGLSVFTSKLAKPFDQDQLEAAISRALRVRGWHTRGQGR